MIVGFVFMLRFTSYRALFLPAIAGLFALDAGAEILIGPRSLSQLGFVNAQIAGIVKGARVLVADYPALRGSLPVSLGGLSDEQINEVLVANFALQTNFQRDLLGILHEGESETPLEIPMLGSALIVNPLQHGRGGVAGISDPRTKTFFRGAIDLKGNGLSVDREKRIALVIAMLDDLRGTIGRSHYNITQFSLGNLTLEHERQQEELKTVQKRLKALPADTPRETRAAVNLELRSVTEDVALLSVYFDAKNALAKAPFSWLRTWIRRRSVAKFLKIVRGMDYMDGVMPASRALKEFIMEKAERRYLDDWNREHGTHYRTVGTLFVILLPIYKILPDGTREPLGILGRQAHWKPRRGSDIYPAFPAGIGEGVRGNTQYDVFGAHVDLELPELRDPRAASFLAYNGDQPPPIDAMAADAVHRFRNGDTSAPTELLTKVLRPFDLPPTFPPRERRDDIRDLNSSLHHYLEEEFTAQATVMEAARSGRLRGEDLFQTLVKRGDLDDSGEPAGKQLLADADKAGLLYIADYDPETVTRYLMFRWEKKFEQWNKRRQNDPSAALDMRGLDEVLLSLLMFHESSSAHRLLERVASDAPGVTTVLMKEFLPRIISLLMTTGYKSQTRGLFDGLWSSGLLAALVLLYQLDTDLAHGRVLWTDNASPRLRNLGSNQETGTTLDDLVGFTSEFNLPPEIYLHVLEILRGNRVNPELRKYLDAFSKKGNRSMTLHLSDGRIVQAACGRYLDPTAPTPNPASKTQTF